MTVLIYPLIPLLIVCSFGSQADPKFFFHSRFDLKDRLAKEQSKDSPDDALIADIKVALQYIEEDNGNDIADFMRLTDHQEITFDLLWALFTPNTLMYRYHDMTEQVQVLLVRSVIRALRQDLSIYVRIECDVINNDGNSFGLARDMIEIDSFPGSRKIQDLPIYPLKYREDQNTIRDHAVSRGKRFVTMDRHSYNEISGQAMRETISDRYDEPPKRFKFHVRGWQFHSSLVLIHS